MTADILPLDGCEICSTRDGRAMGWYKDESTGEPILCPCMDRGLEELDNEIREYSLEEDDED